MQLNKKFVVAYGQNQRTKIFSSYSECMIKVIVTINYPDTKYFLYVHILLKEAPLPTLIKKSK